MTVRQAFGRLLGRLRPRQPNLAGDRDIEWSWMAAQMPPGPGQALDFGSGGSHLALVAVQRGYAVTALDLGPSSPLYVHPAIRSLQGDILTVPLPERHFDLVLNCSTVEHVGLVGRYGVGERRPDGDLEAMARLRAFMRPSGTMLLTIPVGRDAVFEPLCRVYGSERLPRLLQGFSVVQEAYWVKDGGNRWTLQDRAAALTFSADVRSWSALRNVYALGLFVLRRSAQETLS